MSVIQSVGTKSLRNPVSYNKRYESQKDSTDTGRMVDRRTTKLHCTEQNKTECKRTEMPCTRHPLVFSPKKSGLYIHRQ